MRLFPAFSIILAVCLPASAFGSIQEPPEEEQLESIIVTGSSLG